MSLFSKKNEEIFERAAKHLIVAIDNSNLSEVLEITKKVKGFVYAIKLGMEFFYSNGLSGLEVIKKQGVKIFLDLKLHDIPNTAFKATEAIFNKIEVDMFTLHASGGSEMLSKIVAYVNEKSINTKLIAVTLLTSISQQECVNIGYAGDVESSVVKLAKLANNAGMDGVVCSGYELSALKAKFAKYNNDFIYVVPGIRPRNSVNNDDQERVLSGAKAILLGASYIVVGRPILRNKNIQDSIEQIFL